MVRSLCLLLCLCGLSRAESAPEPGVGPQDFGPFREACVARNEPEALKILEARPQIAKQRDGDQRTPLHLAARYGLAEACRRLIDAGCPLDANAYNNFTALHLAAMNNRVEVVRLLIEAGADVEVKTSFSSSALREAAWRGYREVIGLLLDAGASYDMRTAASLGDVARVQDLLAQGSTEHQDPMVLRSACMAGHVDVVAALLQAGVDPDAAPFMGQPAICSS